MIIKKRKNLEYEKKFLQSLSELMPFFKNFQEEKILEEENADRQITVNEW